MSSETLSNLLDELDGVRNRVEPMIDQLHAFIYDELPAGKTVILDGYDRMMTAYSNIKRHIGENPRNELQGILEGISNIHDILFDGVLPEIKKIEAKFTTLDAEFGTFANLYGFSKAG